MKWEYFVKDIGANFNPPEGQTEILSHYGKEGWELVAVLSVEQGEFAYFKRINKEYEQQIIQAQTGTVPVKEGI
jgi:hypothetical protein